MSVEVIGTLVPKNNGTFPVVSDRHVSRGNVALLPLLASSTDVLVRHVSDTGNDITGDGLSAGTAWATLGRLADEIPLGVTGTIKVFCHGAGPFAFPVIPDYKPPGQLYIDIYGDIDTPAETFTISTPGAVVNNGPDPDNDGYKTSVFDYNVGTYSTTFTNGSHWLYNPSGSLYKGFLMDGINSSSPNLRVVYLSDINGTVPTLEAHQFKTVISKPFQYSDIVSQTRSDYFGQRVTLIGCITEYARVIDVAIEACRCLYDLQDESWACSLYVHSSCEIVVNNPSANHYAGSSVPQLNGIFDPTGYGFGHINVFNRSILIRGICRFTTSDSAAISIGSHSGGAGAPGGCGVDVDNLDAEDVSTLFYLESANMRVSNNGQSSVYNVNRYALLERLSRLEINGGVYGRTSGPSVTLGVLSQLEVPNGYLGTAPKLRNGTTPGQDVVVGGLPTPVAFDDAPITDASLAVSSPNDCKFARFSEV